MGTNQSTELKDDVKSFDDYDYAYEKWKPRNETHDAYDVFITQWYFKDVLHHVLLEQYHAFELIKWSWETEYSMFREPEELVKKHKKYWKSPNVGKYFDATKSDGWTAEGKNKAQGHWGSIALCAKLLEGENWRDWLQNNPRTIELIGVCKTMPRQLPSCHVKLACELMKYMGIDYRNENFREK